MGLHHQEQEERARERLESGVRTLGEPALRLNIALMWDYLLLLKKWNNTYNLTSLSTMSEMVTYHALDALTIAAFCLDKDRLVDVGSGAGFPGVPLALCFPEKTFLLIDCVGKKVRFIEHALRLLDIANVHLVQARVEHYQPAVLFDAVITRAFSQIPNMLSLTDHLSGSGGEFLFMKGMYPQEELNAVPERFVVRDVQPLVVPGVSVTRHLVRITKHK